jgi:cyclic pyranopterin phosphate synthase
MAKSACIIRLTRFPEKNIPGEHLKSALLLENKGMEGDYHANGGQRQISLLSLKDRQWMDAQTEKGLCFTEYRENILFNSQVFLQPGIRFNIGEAIIETSGGSKHYFEHCPFIRKGKHCVLAGQYLFAKVIKGGIVRTGDEVTMIEKSFSHFDGSGNAIMADVSGKEITERYAAAKGTISINPEILAAIQSGAAKKGDVLGVARIAGISAAKQTANLIPLCHPLIFDACKIDFNIDEKNLKIEAVCTVRLSGKTGADMEALTGVCVTLLAIYDMCKSIDRSMKIGDIRLVEKSGGKSGTFKNE